MKDTLGLDFINRTLRTTGIILLIFFPFGIYYLGFYPALAVFSGGIWGMVNLLLLTRLVRAAIRPEGADKGIVAGVALVKFPLLYAAGYFLVTTTVFDPLEVLIGFSVLLAVIVLKIIARALFGTEAAEETPDKREHLQGAV